MKRSIRFRVWDHMSKKFHPIEGASIRIDEKKGTGVLSPHNEKDVIQQSINLKDIDGKEIFEGDVVDLYAKRVTSYKPKPIHQASVRWLDAYACFGLYQYKDGQEVPIYKVDPRKLRVLGNVLEAKPKQTKQTHETQQIRPTHQ
jgi:uncharacterized phage protein (TIGR01671 family)